MDQKKIEARARKLHQAWLADNEGFVERCRRDPQQTRCSRDFPRAVPWAALPPFWKESYRREARILMLNDPAAG